MDLKSFEQLLKNMNNGILRGAKRNLANKLKVNESLIGRLANGKQTPSEKLLKEMSKFLNTSESNLKKIFDLSINNNIIGNKNNVSINTETEHLKKELSLAKEKIIFLEEQVAFYKTKK